MDIISYVNPNTIYAIFCLFHVLPITIAITLVLIAVVSRYSDFTPKTHMKLCISTAFIYMVFSIALTSFYSEYPPSIIFWIMIVVCVVPAYFVSFLMWKGIQMNLTVTIFIVGVSIAICAFFYPKPYQYFNYSNISTPILFSEVFRGIKSEYTFPESFRVATQVTCACRGVLAGNSFGEYPFQYSICLGLPHSCRSEIVDMCPNEPVGTTCAIVRTTEL